MRKIALRVTFGVFLLFAAWQVQAMSWPAGNAALIRNFGWNNMGSPVLGMVFSGSTDVLAAESGEIIFTSRPGSSASRLPSPLGAWTAVDHGDGLISIYSRYGQAADRERRVMRQQPIARTGISGWSNREGVYFKLFDRRERNWVNPAILMTPVHNTLPFQILSVNLINSQGEPVENEQLQNLSQGRFRIAVATNDNVDRAFNNFLAPYRIVSSINGVEVGTLSFESIFARDGILMVQRGGLVPASQIFSPSPAVEVADVFLNSGQANLEIIIEDFAGNTRRSLTQIVVN
ncbi:MAG: M23 family metallopeptidase [Spirochaetes bacterium]|nr:M23 family metallopeptidase [Spirochaetota bacterium]